MIFDEDIQKSVQDNRSSTTDDLSKIVKPFGEGRIIVPAFLGLSLLGNAIHNPSLEDLGLITLESLAVDGIFVGTLQAVLGRDRPVKIKGSNSYDPFSEGGSFPSGHASVAFNIATILSDWYKEHGVVPILSYFLASPVGFSRINDNDHFASDVLAGTAFGIATAKLTLYQRKHRKLSVVPQISEDYRGLAVNYRW